MAYSYTEYTASGSITTSTIYTAPPYLEGRGSTDIKVTVDGSVKAQGIHYELASTAVTFKAGYLPTNGQTIRITRSSSQDTRLNDYADASLLTADTLDADANQLFFIAQEALDTASETNLAAATFYSSGTSAPSSATAGDLFFNTATGLLQVYTGSAWESINNRGTKQTFAISTSTTVFTPSTPVDDNTLVFLNGVLLVKGSGSAGDYTSSSTQVTLNTAVSSGVVEVVTFPNATNNTFTGTITADGISLGDDKTLSIGSGNDFTISHNSTNHYTTISETNTTGGLDVKAANFVVKNATGTNEYQVVCQGDGASNQVLLYHGQPSGSGDYKLATTANGIDVTGTVTADGLTMLDSEKITLGTGGDLEIYHNGSNSVIEEKGTGNLFIKGTDLILEDTSGNKFFKAVSGGAVQIWHNSASHTDAKLSTSATGINVTGTVTPSGGYKSSDGTAGFTGSASASATLTIKDGLIVAVS